MDTIETVGIIGAGKLGVSVAQLALKAGFRVYIAGSGSSEKIALSTRIITPGAVAATTEEAVRHGDVVVLAIPLGKFRDLDPALFDNKIVIDGMNHWYEVDGPLSDIFSQDIRTSEAVQLRLPNAIVIKALNHMGYHHLRDEAKDRESTGRKAMAVAGDDEKAVQLINGFVDSLGFDPLYIGKLDDSEALESGNRAFGANLAFDELKNLVA